MKIFGLPRLFQRLYDSLAIHGARLHGNILLLSNDDYSTNLRLLKQSSYLRLADLLSLACTPNLL